MKKLLGVIVLVSVVFIVSIPQTFAQMIYACIDDKGGDKGDMRFVPGPGMCKKGEFEISWIDPEPKFGKDTNWAAAGQGRECTLGEIILTAGSVANGVPANGQVLQIIQNQALFALLGNKYGGDGINNFALPDLRGVAPNGLTYSICVSGIFPIRE